MLVLYENIKKRRLELDMSQEELANKMGYKSRSSINKIELGENDIPQSKIQAFADALFTTPSKLMGWDEESELNKRISENAPSLLGENASDENIALLSKLIHLTPENRAILSELIDLYQHRQDSATEIE